MFDKNSVILVIGDLYLQNPRERAERMAGLLAESTRVRRLKQTYIFENPDGMRHEEGPEARVQHVANVNEMAALQSDSVVIFVPQSELLFPAEVANHAVDYFLRNGKRTLLLTYPQEPASCYRGDMVILAGQTFNRVLREQGRFTVALAKQYGALRYELSGRERSWYKFRYAEAYPLPHTVMLELTTHCNLRCKECPFHGKEHRSGNDYLQSQDKKMMDYDLASLAIDQLAQVHPSSAPGNVIFGYRGEASLYPRFLDILSYTRARGVNFSFLTNGMRYTEEKMQAIMALEPESILVSLDSAYPDELRRVREGAEYDDIARCIDRLLKLRDEMKSRTVIQIIIANLPSVVHGGNELIERWLDRVDRINIANYVYTDGQGRRISQRFFVPAERSYCAYLNSITVLVDGSIMACCSPARLDKSSPAYLGNLRTLTLADAYHKTKWAYYRECHRDHRPGWGMPDCERCCFWSLGDIQRFEKEGDHYLLLSPHNKQYIGKRWANEYLRQFNELPSLSKLSRFSLRWRKWSDQLRHLMIGGVPRG